MYMQIIWNTYSVFIYFILTVYYTIWINKIDVIFPYFKEKETINIY